MDGTDPESESDVESTPERTEPNHEEDSSDERGAAEDESNARRDPPETATIGPSEFAQGVSARTPPIDESIPDSDLDLDSPEWYLNRELSELSFQWRVLYEALDDRNPPLERLRFLSILTRNMDEFFMKRIGGLKQQLAANVTEPTVDGRTPRDQWTASLETAAELFETQSQCFTRDVRPLLSEAGIEISGYAELSDADIDRLRSYFESSVLPTLTPLTFDPAHPFPFISNLSLSLAVLSEDDAGDERFSRIKIPANRPRLISVADPGTPLEERSDDHRVVKIEEVIEANLDLLFPNVEIRHTSTFRVTRNAEVRRNEDVAEGLIDRIEDVLRQRRFATVVRLEVTECVPDPVLDLLVTHLEVDESEVFRRSGPLALGDFAELCELDYPELKLDPWTPRQHPQFAGLSPDAPGDVFEALRERDKLVHHPYHSFRETVQRFLDAAAHDPDTLAIKVAIYRTAPDSKVIRSLIDAAKNGKQVAVMVELKARFDEENNLRWVKRLEEEGIHVAYGSIGLKTHSKVALAVREEADSVRIYSHVASGNYHSETAKGYVDLGLFTVDPDIGQDLIRLFNSFTGHSRHDQYRKLLVAPETLRSRIYELIDREIQRAETGDCGRIVAKMNALEDPGVVEKLYEAGRARVEVDLIVRGICRLRPGIVGVSDTVRVHSVVGRFLEHSRIFRFGGDDPAYFIGSADWMTRNLDRRVEAVAPVEDPTLRSELDAVLSVMLADNRTRWTMRRDGSYVQRRPEPGEPSRGTHGVLMDRARRTAPDDRSHPGSDPGREPSIDLDEVYTTDPFDG
ncbi:MAG: polyphosphate kinase 1 [Halobacteriota archaeon]|uniref:polyphosphate kinase 1 n=1 Tax=Natronomonas sp. TaxID=2184060 RepID=UPI00397572E7